MGRVGFTQYSETDPLEKRSDRRTHTPSKSYTVAEEQQIFSEKNFTGAGHVIPSVLWLKKKTLFCSENSAPQILQILQILLGSDWL